MITNNLYPIFIKTVRRIVSGVRNKLDLFFVNLYLYLIGCKVGRDNHFLGFPDISMMPNTSITFGNNGCYVSRNSATALGVNHPLIIRTLYCGAKIFLGDKVGISGGSICAALNITIGNGCLIGADVTICDNDFHPINPSQRRNASIAYQNARPVIIGDNVFIGTKSIILKGVEIGENTVIGAGSVVVKSLPSNVIAAGNPCRVIKNIHE
jgi:acetyltransferase-like isoleucine patch superfamily enzyme